MTQTALILGASGKIGRHFTAALRTQGWQTRAYSRGTDMNAAAQGCALIVNGLNPPGYHDWDRLLPAITAQVIGAARASGATILFPGNVYVYGDQPGPWNETTPHRPCSRKGRLRATAEAQYRAATDQGVRVIILRAGDFLDDAPGDSALDVIYLRSLSKGAITTPGDPTVRRAHAYLPDLARAGVALAMLGDQLPAFADLPFAGNTFSTQHLKAEVERLQGRSLKLAVFPWLFMRLAGPVWELARELQEMRYLFNLEHRLSDARLQTLLPGFQVTPLPEILRRTLARRDSRRTAA